MEYHSDTELLRRRSTSRRSLISSRGRGGRSSPSPAPAPSPSPDSSSRRAFPQLDVAVASGNVNPLSSALPPTTSLSDRHTLFGSDTELDDIQRARRGRKLGNKWWRKLKSTRARVLLSRRRNTHRFTRMEDEDEQEDEFGGSLHNLQQFRRLHDEQERAALAGVVRQPGALLPPLELVEMQHDRHTDEDQVELDPLEFETESRDVETDEDGGEDGGPVRQQWGSRIEFFFATIGFAVGVGNVYRFPYLAYRYGGGSFLIAYSIFLVLLGLPMVVFELSLGKLFRKGPIKLFLTIGSSRWGGVGIASVITALLVCTYYTILLAWAMVFLAHCFHNPLPWDGNPNFFYERILHLTDSINDLGGMNWWAFLALSISMVLIYLCVFQGVKTSGKVAIVTVSLPYVLLIILFIRGVTLSGAGTGIKYYLQPQWKQLLNVDLWVEAASQIFFSLSPAWGVHITFGSYLPPKENVLQDSIVIAAVNSATSIFAGFVVFSVLGHMSETTGVPIEDVAVGGPSLAFIVFPEALTTLPAPYFFAVLFFLMLVLLGIDSVFAVVELIVASLQESKLVGKYHKRWLALGAVFVLWIGGWIYCTNAGLYFLDVMDHYVPMLSFFFVAILELVCVTWFYDAKRFFREIEANDERPFFGKRIWKILWRFICPALISLLIVMTVIGEIVTPYPMPAWAIALGWIVALLPGTVVLYFALLPRDFRHRIRNRVKHRLSRTQHV